MSSFVINKQEYIKAGGFFAGLAEQLNYYREPVIYWWDSAKGDLLDAEDYYKAFASLYEMNARSVIPLCSSMATAAPKATKPTTVKILSTTAA